ncbi:acyl-[acyl-carrier-protein]-phospholipid O-acyltransferase/long-chain-fatty-acid--[acyl-carrier-protein] ligase [Methylomarinovum tepidoasis]|uniref:Acyl-[acyl-carrier-protein]-phospholipid O-acyltransferase/long-chain-fatty-acid--[acyl-carrier-protein] ligase n=1 Tax=Methylomarinovum tepidoasis TaxID=2840183 RepID=A0AAU9CBI6_9GAMM|nr:AMP-binding protein [Methylomarinovum sp. IN45]BCX89297.1 acyl-[acyl-carrier-protein]-phospholipid O-acyltransferase/long-chain-fatty-acid--[acyl-carrier-protein] ligase [Methylomarinovum sp. IN45]
MLKAVVRLLLRLCYRLRIEGLEPLRRFEGPVLIVANHQSFLDPVILWAFLPAGPTFAINTHIARLWWVRPFLRFAEVVPLDPLQPASLKTLIRRLQAGRRIVIFPEGRITTTGALMKIYEGPGLIADHAGVLVVPVRIDGAQYSPFSRLDCRFPRRWFPRIRVVVRPPRDIRPPEEIKGIARRRRAGENLAALMRETMFVTTPYDRTLLEAVWDARRTVGTRRAVVEDIERRPLGYHGLLTRVQVMAALLRRHLRHQGPVGVLLPSGVAAVVAVLALQKHGRLPAMLNYTAGPAGLTGACRTGTIREVLTARRFVELAGLSEEIAALEAAGIAVHYLEDWRDGVAASDKLAAWTAAWFGGSFRSRPGAAAEPAVMLFTSGSEGAPKAVLLSHRNLLANCAQLAAVLDFNPTDTVLNVLPLFHVFGLGPGTLLPLVFGIRTFLYPNPLHYKVIPELAYEINATVLFGTNTFLQGYGRHAHPYDFHTLRYVFAGAEKLQEEVRRLWLEKFGLRILEGYGATETSPVLAVNTPMHYRSGTVGRFLPGIEWCLEPVEGLAQGGRLHVRGPNVMLGYWLPERPGELAPPSSGFGAGWYDTGDVAIVDDDGFVTLAGRLKRFAKVGGEMVPLNGVESLAARVWPEHRHAAVAVADSRRGEAVVLVTECQNATLEALQSCAREQGVPELWLPRRIVTCAALPLLGSGKLDYRRIQQQVSAG